MTISGRVTDRSGAPVLGATVQIDSTPPVTATTTQFGVFQLPDVTIPAGRVSDLFTVTATRRLGPTEAQVDWTGQNVVEAFSGESGLQNLSIVISNPAEQGSISGIVRDAAGNTLVNARVFAAQALPPDPMNPGQTVFASLTPFQTLTDNTGRYTLPQLPAGTRYVVTASFPGRINQTFSDQIVQANRTTTRNFSLPLPGGGSNVPVVSGFQVRSITMPTEVSRATGTPQNAVAAIRHYLLKRLKADKHRVGAAERVLVASDRTRVTPAGSIIENVLLWDYTLLNNLYGYVILRSINIDTDFRAVAVLYDPLADRFSDSSRTLTPDLLYYYSVARLDTINYPANGTEGDPGFVAVVRPLAPLTLNAPANGANTNLIPQFQWTAVNRADKYQILVYDRFPALQSETDAQAGAAPIWPADPDNPGASLVTGGRTSQNYAGPPLIAGRTYWWTVIASDPVNSSFTISPLRSFTVQ